MYVTTMGVVNKKLTILKEDYFSDYKTGSVNVDRIVFNFSGEEWENLTKIAVFVTKDGTVKDVPLIGNYCDVPIDLYLADDIDPTNINYSFDISVGVYGQLIDEEAGTITKILPTNLVHKKVSLGSYFPGEEPSGLPTAEEWQIYIDEVGRLATQAKNSADSALEAQRATEDIQRELNELAEEMRTLEDNTKGYAANAQSYMNNAESFANNAHLSATNASSYANNASSYANNASNFANSASAFMNNASNYANSASQYANDSGNWANKAAEYMNNASRFANNAGNYAQNASYAANNASAYSQNSSNYANNAANSANRATNASASAQSYANNASNFANNAAQYAANAKGSQEVAQGIESNVIKIYNEIYDISSSRMFAAFNVNPMNGDLIMTTVQSLGNIGFSLDENGNLVVELS